jgi:carboxyl-terminal processing protease
MSKCNIKRYAVFLLVLVIFLVPAVPATEVPVQESLELATFDKAWEIIRDTHFDPTFNGVDWDQVRADLRPKAAESSGPEELRPVLLEMVGRLGQSHFSVIPKSVADEETEATGGGSGTGEIGLEIRVLGEELVVTAVDETGPAFSAGVRAGWLLDAVNGKKVGDWLKLIRENEDWRSNDLRFVSMATAALSGDEGSKVTCAFRDGGQIARKLEIERRETPGTPVKIGNLPSFRTRFDSRQIVSEKHGITVGVLNFNFWMVPLAIEIDNAVDRFRSHQGMVFDLRGNLGGVGGMVMGVAGHILDEKVSLGTFSTRTQTLHFNTNPRRVNRNGDLVAPFAGPVAILVDVMSASTSEMFTAGLQEIGRARVFGARTAGAVLPAYMDRLPNGDVLYHAIADYRTPAGVLVEGQGVKPDTEIPLDRAALLDGRDPVMEAALEWIAEEIKNQERNGS